MEEKVRHLHSRHTVTTSLTLLYSVVFEEKKESPKYTIKYKCDPEKNKLFVFDGKHYHASSCPQHHDARLAITINIVKRQPIQNVKPFLRVA